jgi:hypothetical protein
VGGSPAAAEAAPATGGVGKGGREWGGGAQAEAGGAFSPGTVGTCVEVCRSKKFRYYPCVVGTWM